MPKQKTHRAAAKRFSLTGTGKIKRAKAYKSLDCAGFARVDFFIEKNTGKIYINEINTIPGMTSASLVPKMVKAAGMDMTDFLTEIIEGGL